MSDIQQRFEKLLEKHGDDRYQNAVRQGYGYSDNLIDHAFHCFELLLNSPDNSAPRKAYDQWLKAHHPNYNKNPQVFFEYVDHFMSEDVTDILENKWIYDRNREISHIVKCRMVILSGLSAAALFNE